MIWSYVDIHELFTPQFLALVPRVSVVRIVRYYPALFLKAVYTIVTTFSLNFQHHPFFPIRFFIYNIVLDFTVLKCKFIIGQLIALTVQYFHRM